MALFGFKSKKEVEAEKKQAANNAVEQAKIANQRNVNNLGKGSQFDFRIPYFDAFDPRLQDTGVPVAVGVTVIYSIEDMPTFLSMNKMQDFDDFAFRDKLKSGITKYVKSAVSNAPSEIQIPLVQIERKIVEVSDYVQARVIHQVENVFCIKVRALDITSIDIDKSSRGYLELKALTADFEKERMMAQHNAQMGNFNMQNKMQQEMQMAQHNANLSNFNLNNQLQQKQMTLQSNLNMDAMERKQEMQLDAMERQQEMQIGGQEQMQQMQLEMQRMQMQMQLNNQNETMRIQREEMQRAARLQTESTFFDAHKTNVNASIVNNAMDNGYNPYEQNQQMGMGGMQQPMMGGMQQPMMGGMQQPMMGGMQQPMMGGMQPQVNYMLAINVQQACPFGWAQLQQLVQQGQLTQQTYVWTQGMANWTPAGQVVELAPLFQNCVPQMPGMPGML